MTAAGYAGLGFSRPTVRLGPRCFLNEKRLRAVYHFFRKHPQLFCVEWQMSEIVRNQSPDSFRLRCVSLSLKRLPVRTPGQPKLMRSPNPRVWSDDAHRFDRFVFDHPQGDAFFVVPESFSQMFRQPSFVAGKVDPVSAVVPAPGTTATEEFLIVLGPLSSGSGQTRLFGDGAPQFAECA